jgi:hypothetical protein
MRSYEQKKKEKPSSNAFFSPKIQKKLKTGTVGDKYEVEADKVADEVVNKTATAPNGLIQSKSEEEVQQKPISETISAIQKQEMKDDDNKAQKKEMKEEEPVQKMEEEEVQNKEMKEEEPVQKMEEEEVQNKEMKEEEPVQKMEEEEVQNKETKEEEPVQKMEEQEVQKKEMKEEEPVQKKEEEKDKVQKKETTTKGKSEIETNLKKSKGGGNPMSKAIKLEMENSFSADFSSIRIHTDSNAVSMCQEMKAQAFTNGSDIYFNKGKYNPNSTAGKQLLAHELTHTIQQGAVSVIHKSGSL